MNFLNKGMSFLNNQSGSSSLSNPIALFKQLDSDGNGKITEEGSIQFYVQIINSITLTFLI